MVRLWIGLDTVSPAATPSEPLFFTGSFCFLFCLASKSAIGGCFSFFGRHSRCSGGGQWYCVWGAFFERCARSHLFWNYLAHVLVICHEADASADGFNCCSASYGRTRPGAPGIGGKAGAKSPPIERGSTSGYIA